MSAADLHGGGERPSLTPKQERDLVGATLNNRRRVVPGSVEIDVDRFMWTERCRARCPHDDAACHTARSSLLPLDWSLS